MRITQIMLSKGFGGAERYFVDLSLALAASGHTVQALCHTGFTGRELLSGVPGLEVATVAARGLWDLWSVRRMRRMVLAFGPEIVQAHLARAAWAAGRIVGREPVPLVAKLHNYVKLKYYRGVDAFIVTTRRQDAFLRKSGVPPDRIVHIPNFSSLPPAAGARRPERIPVRFVSCGRMVHKKGFAVLLEAVHELVERGVQLRLAIGGDGPQRAQLRRRADELGIGEQVAFPGWIEDVAAFLAGGDVFVLPSLDEPFGIVVLEAMSQGLPVVSTRTEGPLEILDEASAYFAAVGDAAGLAAAMQAAATDPEASARKAESALIRYRTRYHRDVVVPRVAALYARLAERS